MIDENIIKQETDSYVNDFELGLLTVDPPLPQKQKESLVMTMHNSLNFGLHRGQELFLESLWHDASEEPPTDKALLIAYSPKQESHAVCFFNVAYLIEADCHEWWKSQLENGAKCWLYISDLFPKGGDK